MSIARGWTSKEIWFPAYADGWIELKAIVDERTAGRKMACHAYNGIGLQRALDGGCDSIEHDLRSRTRKSRKWAKQGTWYCPTITPLLR